LVENVVVVLAATADVVKQRLVISLLSLSKAYEYWEKSYLSFKKRSFLSLSPGIYLYTRKDAKAKEMKEKDAPHPTVPQRRNNDVLRGLSLSLSLSLARAR
jgi:hypothetical protein